MLTRFFDWYFSKTIQGARGRVTRLLPLWPKWLCQKLTNHKLELKYADYNVDITGARCRCGMFGRPDNV